MQNLSLRLSAISARGMLRLTRELGVRDDCDHRCQNCGYLVHDAIQNCGY